MKKIVLASIFSLLFFVSNAQVITVMPYPFLVDSVPYNLAVSPSLFAENDSGYVGRVSGLGGGYQLYEVNGNTNFYMVGQYLYCYSPYDYETQTSDTVTIKATNSLGTNYEQITVYITDVAETIPSTLAISDSVISENFAGVIGDLSTNGDGEITYSVVGHSGFIAPNAQLFNLFEYDYEDTTSVTITIRATNALGFYQRNVTITITDQNEAASIGVASFTIYNSTTNASLGTLANGDSINLANFTQSPFNLNIEAVATGAPGSVSFTFTKSGGSTYTRTESVAPYALFGDDSGDYRDWTITAPIDQDTYTLKANSWYSAGASGGKGDSLSITFKFYSASDTTTPPTGATTGTYYISPSGNDANPGTFASPWGTITHANSELVSGDSLVFLNGDYNVATVGQIKPANNGTGEGDLMITYIGLEGGTHKLYNATGYAIDLTNRTGIRVQNITVNGDDTDNGYNGYYTDSNVKGFILMDNTRNCEIAYCSYIKAEGYTCVDLQSDSRYNYIHHNTFDGCGVPNRYNHCELGSASNNPDVGELMHVKGDNNVIVYNTFKHGGHNLFTLDGICNYIAYNTFDGNWEDVCPGSNIGVRGAAVVGRPGINSKPKNTNLANAGSYNFLEYNIFTGTKSTDNPNNTVVKSHGYKQVWRFNRFMKNKYSWNILSNASYDGEGTYYGLDMAFYNNIFYDNGWGTFQARDYNSNDQHAGAHDFFNNVTYNTRNNVVLANGTSYPNADMEFRFNFSNTGSGFEGTEIHHNIFYNTNGKTPRGYVFGAGNTKLMEAWETDNPANVYDNIIQVDPIFSSFTDFTYGVDSPAEGAAAPQTYCANNGNGTVIQLQESKYFFCRDNYNLALNTNNYPSWRGAVVNDMVKIGNNPPVEIVSINYAAHIIAVSQSITWANGDPVRLVSKNKVVNNIGISQD